MGCTWEAVGGAGDVQGGAGLLLGHSLASPTRWGARPLAKQAPSTLASPHFKRTILELIGEH
jgi:hypothetical protein